MSKTYTLDDVVCTITLPDGEVIVLEPVVSGLVTINPETPPPPCSKAKTNG